MNFKGIYDSASEKDIFLVNTTRNMAKPKIISKVFGITMRNLNDKEISSLASFINFDLSKLFEFSSNKTRLVLSIFIILPLMNIGFVLQILTGKLQLVLNGREILIGEKQAIRFRADMPHEYNNPFDKGCTVYNIIFYPNN